MTKRSGSRNHRLAKGLVLVSVSVMTLCGTKCAESVRYVMMHRKQTGVWMRYASFIQARYSMIKSCANSASELVGPSFVFSEEWIPRHVWDMRKKIVCYLNK
jgi:hypothetical protein